ncbi:hypothetical protein Jab_1c14280 [Janthinobacterium sp. HH01]|uniref:hypothetical protein n=1 Tax=Janthinobacterium sp. HH01 TaxID=1198452 RepID=UPI0002AED30F|nr:hypothetical protein [Janthinobacterium sp. HH01]ELX12813.1 hypothetical protein Jab_1c14280 [Janthinobacterium sp. HH01]
MKRISTLIVIATLAVTASSFAADRPVHLRGEVTAVGAGDFVVTDRKGAKTTVKLPEQAQVLDVSRSSQAAIQESSYLGIAAAPAPGGKVRAMGVMVFPEAARGLNEGHFPWDLGDRGTMTNATVAKVVKKASATELEMRFGGKAQQVVLDKDTVYGQFVPGKRELIVVGAKVLVIGASAADGATAANAVLVGRDGFLPPI